MHACKSNISIMMELVDHEESLVFQGAAVPVEDMDYSDAAGFQETNKASVPVETDLRPVTQVRKIFPETWIWTTDVFSGYLN